MKKLINKEQFRKLLKDGQTIMVGGFLAVGTPEELIDEVLAAGVKDLTLICNDTGFPDKGVGKWIAAGIVKKVIASHIGTNPESANQLNAGTTEFVLTPQGTLAEQVRAGGVGLGGILTSTGLGTIAAEGKEVIVVDGKEYLLEKPLRADLALIKAAKADEKGNLVYAKTGRNFNPLMAKAADIVVAEVNEIVPVGEIDPEHVITPGIVVDYVLRRK